MNRPLSEKVAIVTGAGRGRGEAVARALAQAGARVVVNDLNPDRAERVAAAISAGGGTALAVDADVSNKFHCVKLVERSRDAWDRIDILVNNAHVAPTAPLLKMDEWDWNRCLEVNLKGVFLMSQLCGRVMAQENRERGAAIVNVVSAAGVVAPLENRAAFCATQAGVIGFARECARAYMPHGIRVNTVVVALPEGEAGGEPDTEWAPHPPLARQDLPAAVLDFCLPHATATGRVVMVTRL
ncbi:MAG: SDR family NAD(P)-dependent oxidoreductase [Candidatus Promineifilaceae bacterium]|nr:SDR family NAD(P)-dependent oxidoreductase [Candidatus Promineifilaceae bacterium]